MKQPTLGDAITISVVAIRDMECATEHLRRGRVNQAVRVLVDAASSARRDLQMFHMHRDDDATG